MALEIERKFLLKNDTWKAQAGEGVLYKQGYLVGSAAVSVRVRLEGERAFLNLKSATLGVRRQEYEYPIPLQDANEIMSTLCEQPLIEKRRYHLKVGQHVWEIDEFLGENLGLLVAEIELHDEKESFEKPDWLGEEVSDDPRYYNVSLVKNPFRNW